MPPSCVVVEGSPALVPVRAEAPDTRTPSSLTVHRAAVPRGILPIRRKVHAPGRATFAPTIADDAMAAASTHENGAGAAKTTDGMGLQALAGRVAQLGRGSEPTQQPQPAFAVLELEGHTRVCPNAGRHAPLGTIPDAGRDGLGPDDTGGLVSEGTGQVGRAGAPFEVDRCPIGYLCRCGRCGESRRDGLPRHGAAPSLRIDGEVARSAEGGTLVAVGQGSPAGAGGCIARATCKRRPIRAPRLGADVAATRAAAQDLSPVVGARDGATARLRGDTLRAGGEGGTCIA
mmetsp:Transcript_24609/g.79555  ORF Transcript_24609/g.79555 Transcript_24609/m.79555 type:complete len:288 (+) Transcript_24609:2583-3446(+)